MILPMTMPLVLASSSVYRRAQLEQLGLLFSCQSPDIDEAPKTNESAEALVTRLALEKAKAVAVGLHEPSLVIGSDQTAELASGGVSDKALLGKPGSIERAEAQLLACSGRTVRFHTAVSLLNSDTGEQLVEIVPTEVIFRSLSLAQIRRYIELERPLDCAGSFKCEGLGIVLFSAIRSADPSALTGLPLIALTNMLLKFGLDPLKSTNLP